MIRFGRCSHLTCLFAMYEAQMGPGNCVQWVCSRLRSLHNKNCQCNIFMSDSFQNSVFPSLSSPWKPGFAMPLLAFTTYATLPASSAWRSLLKAPSTDGTPSCAISPSVEA